MSKTHSNTPSRSVPNSIVSLEQAAACFYKLLPNWWWAMFLTPPTQETPAQQQQTAEWLLRVHATLDNEQAQRQLIARLEHDYEDIYIEMARSGSALAYSPLCVAKLHGIKYVEDVVAPADLFCGMPEHMRLRLATAISANV